MRRRAGDEKAQPPGAGEAAIQKCRGCARQGEGENYDTIHHRGRGGLCADAADRPLSDSGAAQAESRAGDRADGPTWHMSKAGTPTMGGIMFILAPAWTVFVLGWQNMLEGNSCTCMCICSP